MQKKTNVNLEHDPIAAINKKYMEERKKTSSLMQLIAITWIIGAIILLRYFAVNNLMQNWYHLVWQWILIWIGMSLYGASYKDARIKL